MPHDTLLDVIPALITPGLNDMLIDVPTLEEVRDTIFSLSGDSAPGPDGFTGKFFSSCWDIIGSDLLSAILEFFAGFDMLKSWTSTLIATIPKTDVITSCKDLRPISLCNFCNKVVTKLLSI